MNYERPVDIDADSFSARLAELIRFQFHVLKAVNQDVRRPYCYIHSCGPWIEDFWQDLSELDVSEFGGFVPLFVPWNKLFVGYMKHGYPRIVSDLFKEIDPKFLYATVTQNPAGIECRRNPQPKIPPNIFVLSQGGQGHIPLLLWLVELFPFGDPPPPVADRVAVFVGAVRKASVRLRMWETVNKSHQDNVMFMKDHYPFQEWISLYKTSKFVLCPRGYGRNSFRLTETLQLGLVPVYVWDDVVWLPYYDSINWSSFAVVTNIRDFDATLSQLEEMPMETVIAMREKVKSMYSSHFTSIALVGQIRALLRGGFAASDLRCSKFLHYP
jgi:hypothetical protein